MSCDTALLHTEVEAIRSVGRLRLGGVHEVPFDVATVADPAMLDIATAEVA